MSSDNRQPGSTVAQKTAAVRYCPDCTCWRSHDMMDDGSYRCRVCGGAANGR